MFNDFFAAISEGDPSAIALLIYAIARAVLGVFEIIATKNTWQIKKNQKEDTSVKTRLPDYQEAKGYKKPKTVFSQYIPEYKYNEKTGELKETGGKIDVQAMIQSYVDTCLSAVLDKFLPGNDLTAVGQNDVYGEVKHTELNDLADMYEQAEVYREKYGLSDELSAVEVFKAVDDMSQKQNAYVKGLTKQSDPKPEPKQEPQINVDEAIAYYKAHALEVQDEKKTSL